MSGHTAIVEALREAEARVVALEGRVAAVRALADTYAREAELICPERTYDKADKAWRVAHVRRRVAGEIRAALASIDADRGTGRDGEGS